MRRFIIAPDSFKGSMSAREICDILASAVEEIVPDADIIKIPMSDGGEGMVDAYLGILGGEKKQLCVTGPKDGLLTLTSCGQWFVLESSLGSSM